MTERQDGRNYWQRMRRKQMSRRALLRATGRAGVGAAGLALVGCGDDDDDAAVTQVAQQQDQQQQAMQQQDQPQQQQQAMQQQQGQQQQQDSADQQAAQADQQEAMDDQQQQQVVSDVPQPQYGGTLKISGPVSTHDYWDPHRGVFGPTQFMHGWVYNYIIRWKNKEKAEMQYDLAGLPEIPDGSTYIFTVTDGASWHDAFPTEGGRAVTAEDLRFNIQRQKDAFDSTGVEDSTFLSSTSWRKIAHEEAVDDSTLRITSEGVDSTFLSASFLNPFGWQAAPEGIQAWGMDTDLWRDEQTVLRVAGSGPYIAEFFDPNERFVVRRNPNYWKYDAAGNQLPYPDGFEYVNLFDETATETAFRSKQIDTVGLNIARVDSLMGDFPDLDRRITAGGFTIQCRTNFNPDWPGEDGQGNPWLDRRMWAAFHVATDRYLMIDTVYLGSAKPSALPETPWFSAFWAPTEDELITWPGYKPDRDAELQLVSELMDATGFRDTGRTLDIILPDVWEERYPGITETTKSMYESAMGIELKIDIQPYTVVLQRLVEGTYPGDGPSWTNPPADLDPTSTWLNGRVPGGSSNLYHYEHPRVTELSEQMKVTLDLEEKKVMSDEVVQIMMGVHPDTGWEGIAPSIGVMNPINHTVNWPWFRPDPDIYQFAHAGHRYDGTWLDTGHPDYPA